MPLERVNQAASIDPLKQISSICRMLTLTFAATFHSETKVFSNNYLAVPKFTDPQEALAHSLHTVVAIRGRDLLTMYIS